MLEMTAAAGGVGYLPAADAYETVANRHLSVGIPFAPRSEQILKEAMRKLLSEVTQ